MLCSSCQGTDTREGGIREEQPHRRSHSQSWSLSPLTSTMSTPAWSPAERSKFPVRRRYWNLAREDSAGDRQGHSQEGDRNHQRGQRTFSGRPRCYSSSRESP